MDKLRDTLRLSGMDLNEFLFPLSPQKLAWKPFVHALFVPDSKRPDSFTVLSRPAPFKRAVYLDV